MHSTLQAPTEEGNLQQPKGQGDTPAAIKTLEIKVLIEQIRERAQNIE